MKSTVVGSLVLVCLFWCNVEVKAVADENVLKNIDQCIWQGHPPQNILQHNIERGFELFVLLTAGSLSVDVDFFTEDWYQNYSSCQEVKYILETNAFNSDGQNIESKVYAFEECECGVITDKEKGVKSVYLFQWDCGIAAVYSFYGDDASTYTFGGIKIDFNKFRNRDDLCRAISTFELSGLLLDKGRHLSTGGYSLDFDYRNCQDNMYVDNYDYLEVIGIDVVIEEVGEDSPPSSSSSSSSSEVGDCDDCDAEN